MKRLRALSAFLFWGLAASMLPAQQDTGPGFAKLSVQRPASGKLPPKFDAPYVFLGVTVDENGSANHVHVIGSAGSALDAKAIEAVNTNHFPQRKQGGLPVAYGTQVVVSLRAASQPGSELVAKIEKVSPPVVLFAAPPEFTEEARRKHVSGNVLVRCLIDEKGQIQNVRVERGLGSGLDEKAMEAVRRYRFSPATIDGKAISFPMNIEVNWDL